MQKPKLIQELKQESNVAFKQVDIEKIMEHSYDKTSQYAINGKGEIIGLKIKKLKLKELPKNIQEFKDLRFLNLYDNQISDISALSNLTNITELSLVANQVSDISVLSNLTNLTKLNLLGNEIIDISALSNLTNLIELSLAANQVSDISILSNLTNLTGLDLNSTLITDISSLSNLTNLTVLDLHSTQITDISSLSNLTNLTVLDLYSNKITDISALSNLTNLIELDLFRNQITDISALSNLTKLTELSLLGNEIIDISALSNLTNLTRLKLLGNEIIDISALSNLTKLTELYLLGNEIIDISALSNLTKLTELSLLGNEIIDISALSNLTNLTELRLEDNQITDISVLSNLTNLTELSLEDNQITDISVLSNLTKLTKLYLLDNEIIDISTLSNLTKLTELRLVANQVSDISVLSNLTNLTALSLAANQVSDISALSNLINLTELDLGSNKLSDISALSNLTNLTKLYLEENKISDILALNNLNNLSKLDLKNNKLTDISILSNLTKLTNLNLERNKISDISALKRLEKLEKLELGRNLIKKLPEWIYDFKNLKFFYVSNNPLKEPPIEIVKQGKAVIKDYFENKKIAETEVKLILTGNSRAGKTTLFEFMKNPKVFTNEESTHGITVENINWKNYNLNVWDFGGQDYYHATHRLFLTNNAVYILVWEQNTNKTEKKETTIFIDKEQKTEVIKLQNYDYYHWLTVIRKYDDLGRKNSKDENLKTHKSPVVMLQNKIDDTEIGNNQIEKLNKSGQERYSIDENNLFAISIKETHKNWENTARYAQSYVNEYKNFENRLQELVKQELKDRQVLEYDVAIRKAVREREENIISFSDYKNMCNKVTASVLDKPITDEQIRFATERLHTQGVLIYYGYISDSNRLKENVFIKPQYVTNIIYKILNKNVKNNDGKFTLNDAVEVLQTFQQSEEAKYDAQLFIDLMKSPNFELIFEDKYETNTYYATQYLPEELKNRELNYFNKDKRTLPLAFVIRFDNYFSASIISRFIARYGFYADKKEKETTVFWKYGISFVRRDFSFLVYCDFEQKKIYVHTEKSNLNNEIVFDIYNSIKDFAENDENISISLDDKNFDTILDIKEAKNKEYWFCFGKKYESVTISNNIVINGDNNIVLQDVNGNDLSINNNYTEKLNEAINAYKENEKNTDYTELIKKVESIKLIIKKLEKQVQYVDIIPELLFLLKKYDNNIDKLEAHLTQQDKILEDISLQISSLEKDFTTKLSPDLKTEFEEIKSLIFEESKNNGLAIADELMKYIDFVEENLSTRQKEIYDKLKQEPTENWKTKIKFSIPILSLLGVKIESERELKLNKLGRNLGTKLKHLYKPKRSA